MSSKIEITSCSDSQKWYSDKIGGVYEITGVFSDTCEYRTRQDDGYTNFVSFCDAKLLVEVSN